MPNIFSFIISNLETIVEKGGYLFLFISTVLEGIPIIGQFTPGHTIVMVYGFLSRVEVFNIVWVSIIVILSALLGDSIGFLMGKKYGLPFLERFGKYFFLKKEHIEKAQQLIKENTAKTIIIGRFGPVTRPITPFIVGASNISLVRFAALDFIGVLIWSIFSVGIGYIFGASYHVVAGFLGKYIFIAIILGILIAWGYRFINKQFHIFAKYELITLIVNLFGLYVFFKTIQDALSDHTFMAELDVYIHIFFNTHFNPFWFNFMKVVSMIFSPSIIIVLGLISIIYFIHKKRWRRAVITTTSLAGGYFAVIFIKEFIMRLRPEDALMPSIGYSFPSAHAVGITIFFTLLVYFFIGKIKSIALREILIVISVLLILLTSFSRVYLGVHWLSDVIAGIGFGLFWTTLMILFVKYVYVILKRFNHLQD